MEIIADIIINVHQSVCGGKSYEWFLSIKGRKNNDVLITNNMIGYQKKAVAIARAKSVAKDFGVQVRDIGVNEINSYED